MFTIYTRIYQKECSFPCPFYSIFDCIFTIGLEWFNEANVLLRIAGIERNTYKQREWKSDDKRERESVREREKERKRE